MPLYMYQGTYTPESWAAQLKNPQNRVDAVGKAVCEAAGGKMICGAYCFGDYDIVLIADMPNDEAMSAVAIAITAEMTRPPFDLVEAEEELSGGYNMEYSSIDFAWFYLAEYAALVTNSAIMVTLWFGGPDGPRIAHHSIGPVWWASTTTER